MKELEVALNYENEGVVLYEKLASSFDLAVFSEILLLKQTGLNLLNKYKKDEVVVTPQDVKFNGKKEALNLALDYELRSGEIYDLLSDTASDEELRDLFFRLWATSNNEYQKALQNEISNLESKENGFDFDSLKNLGINLDKKSINELNQILGKFKDGKASKDDINAFLENPYFSFISGAMLGAVGGILIKEILKNSNENL
ncbi:hypothetical protein [Campylobacter corcagiensis]|uniref:Uncharacterized protein n=1 Tax=Campylobacter corcagiensis TaxID=1448857 RepID=A0A7M1LFV3_9BACT|nr:hypothetical protein [Campylobacter corcagiensis]QKF64646.1 hypothetical protein CCORG_0789 [Campylobacter corcagiensis]QOQ87183.1 hypothetical protein IMC76_08230 [Campylobacter corcagiensis]